MRNEKLWIHMANRFKNIWTELPERGLQENYFSKVYNHHNEKGI